MTCLHQKEDEKNRCRYQTKITAQQKLQVQHQYGQSEDWKFDYCYDYRNRGTKFSTHGIENYGKTVTCNCYSDGEWLLNCHCFFATFSFGMKPQSGKYKIKFKIDRISSFAREERNIWLVLYHKNIKRMKM